MPACDWAKTVRHADAARLARSGADDRHGPSRSKGGLTEAATTFRELSCQLAINPQRQQGPDVDAEHLDRDVL